MSRATKAAADIEVRDRIKELRRVRASELVPDRKNCRRYLKAQDDAFRGLLSEVAYADALIACETPHGLVPSLDES